MLSPALALALSLFTVNVEMPQVKDDRLQLQLVLAEPDIATPTGLAVDDRGRVLVIESNTHFRPEGYKGPEKDRILLLDQFGEDGKAGRTRVFFEGTTHTMNLAVYHDGSIYVATRSEIFRLRDTDDDGRADERTPICHLETKGNYPHNGLSGFAFDFAGNVYFGFGENLGADYTLIGRDKKELAGGGEGGNIYTCKPDGSDLRRLATGFWNPFHLCFDAFGRLFAVDNDPDSRPPCRLLHIVEGGDYGFRFRNGRKGTSPLTAWNGELPGTLPMVSGTGEAPCAILAYESDNLPEEYRGDLLVTSWGDHRIERYRMKPRGASFSAEMIPVVVGGEQFRPVGMAMAPDGSIYFSDWVDKSYQLHGKGRVWRLSAKHPPNPNRPEDPLKAIASPHGPWREMGMRKLSPKQAVELAGTHANPRTRALAASVGSEGTTAAFLALWAAEQPKDFSELYGAFTKFKAGATNESVMKSLPPKHAKQVSGELRAAAMRAGFPIYFDDPTPVLGGDDPFLVQAAATLTLDAMREHPESFERSVVSYHNGLRGVSVSQAKSAYGWALVMRNWGTKEFDDCVPPVMLLDENDPRVQLIGLRWIADTLNPKHRDWIEQELLPNAKTRQVFEVALAVLDAYDRKESEQQKSPKAETSGDDYVARLLKDNQTPTTVRQFAMRSLRRDHPLFTAEFLLHLLNDKDPAIRLEAIRTARQRGDKPLRDAILAIAADKNAPESERAEAVHGLDPYSREGRELLGKLAVDASPVVSADALRTLRGVGLSGEERSAIEKLAEDRSADWKELAERVLHADKPPQTPPTDDLAAWVALADGKGDASVGERIFFSSRGVACARCHEFQGRGATIGPDLSTISRSLNRERVIQSIVTPSKEIAPQFTPWVLLLNDGRTVTGTYTGEEVDGTLRIADNQGQIHRIHPRDIEARKPSEQSIMPAGLAQQLTEQEWRDLLAFLLGAGG